MSVPQQLSGFNNQIPPRYAIKSITRAYRITGADYGQILNCSGGTSYTLSTAPAASIGVGFNCWIWNSNVTALTIDPNGTETIGGTATLILRPGEGTQITSDGANWQLAAKKTMVLYSENSSGFINRPIATGQMSVAIGDSTTASGNNSIAIGNSNGATGVYALAFGRFSGASGTNSVAFNTGSAIETFKYAYGASPTVGSAQFSFMPLVGSTTDGTSFVLSSDGSSVPASVNQLILDGNGSAYTFSMLVTARQKSSDGTNSAAWKIEGLIRRESTADSTTLVASNTTIISNVPGWSIAVSADTTLGGLTVTATGAAATNILWQAVVQTSEITYA
jgi:hypothetical protein